MTNQPLQQSDLAGRVALVTGGSRGIGQATCRALAAKGASIVVHYRAQAEAAGTVVQAIRLSGGQAVALSADLIDPFDTDRMLAQAVAQLGKIDILVNNAGEMTDSSVEDLSDEDWEQALAVNLSSAFRCTRACIPLMKTNGWGRIINVSSQAAYSGSANHAHYAAAKSGLLGLTYSLAKELGPSGITVNLVSPGRIVTDMLMERAEDREEEWLKQTPLRRLGRAEEVAAAIAFLASEEAGYITGANLHVNGGLVMG